MCWLSFIRSMAVLICFAMAIAGSVQADDRIGQPTSSSRDQHPGALLGDGRPQAGFDIREDIRNARQFLKDKKCGYALASETAKVLVKDKRGRSRSKVVRRRVIDPFFLLAVEDLKERKLRLVKFTNKGCETNGFDVVKTRRNGVASRFEVRSPGNMAVLALRTVVHWGDKGYKEVVYTPYSPEIDTPQVRQDGLSYLKGQIESAWSDLEARNVRLGGFNVLSPDIAPTEVALVLSIIEHIDPLRFKNCPPGGEIELVHEVLTIIGANLGDAYAYSRSPAGARGLFQFIPRTYERMFRKYREARLDANFVSGCNNHENAAKASLLLFDSDLNDLPDDYLRTIGDDVEAVGRYLAAAYNCGSRRVEKSRKACSDGWTCLLPEETKIYLKKFDVVWRMRQTLDR